MNKSYKSIGVILILAACIVMVLPFVLLLLEDQFTGDDDSILSKLIGEL